MNSRDLHGQGIEQSWIKSIDAATRRGISMRNFDDNEERFVYLVRLSWDLSQFGLSLAVECPSKG
ncbi:hypothetical protein [Nonomuraea sp. NPDC049028]|uniref:hypothetical protein n=1 Tax=Nonomuraea sp. NPDC049028 TaxID=3364348 RepID=UPI0037102C7A